jgi:hypothetical protein
VPAGDDEEEADVVVAVVMVDGVVVVVDVIEADEVPLSARDSRSYGQPPTWGALRQSAVRPAERGCLARVGG